MNESSPKKRGTQPRGIPWAKLYKPKQPKPTMKKRNQLSILTILLASFASAGPLEGLETLGNGIREGIIIIIRFIGDLILDINSFDELLFAKLLIFAIILLVTYTVVKQNTLFGGRKNQGIQWIISFAVAILAVRYLPDDFVQAILLQYGILGVGIAIFLPFIIFFFFIHQSGIGIGGRRIGWAIYMISFISLWVFRYDEIGEANSIYWIGMFFALLAIIFDKKIHQYFGLSGIRKAMKLGKVERRIKAQKDLDELEKNRKYFSNESEYDKLKEKYEKQIVDNL